MVFFGAMLVQSSMMPPPPVDTAVMGSVRPGEPYLAATPVPTSRANERALRSNHAIRDAIPQDAASVAKLGASTFAASFGFSIPPADLHTYLTEAYSTAAIEEDIRDPSKHVLVACFEDQIIGFAQLTEGTTEPCIKDPDQTVELQRLYVRREFHGTGVGKSLTRNVETVAKELGYRAMWLGVWEGNFKAQRVYEAMGFTRIGDHEFKMGQCIQTDWIMVKDL